jgi:hypothetical protein
LAVLYDLQITKDPKLHHCAPFQALRRPYHRR